MFKKYNPETSGIGILSIAGNVTIDCQREQSEVLQRLKGIEIKMASIEQELVEANKKSTK